MFDWSNVSLNWFKKAAKAEADAEVGAGVPEVEEGSTYKVPYTTILEIKPHDKADRLEFAIVYGFQVIVTKGKYKTGDKVVYIPIDSILPEWLETKLFPIKHDELGNRIGIHLNNSRIRQIKLKGYASQGMLIDPKDITEKVNPEYLVEEQDLKKILDVKKYEPPVRYSNLNAGGQKQRNKKNDHPDFHKYNGLDNIKWFPNKFNETTPVVIQEKLHGTNARASLLPFRANTFVKKVKLFFNMAPATEQCYGSNNVEISSKAGYAGYYGEDVYGKVFKEIDVFSKLKLGETVFGEIVGPGIQKGYTYGLKGHRFVLFDVKILEKDGSQCWLCPREVLDFAQERGFEFVPILYEGPFNKELSYELTKGKSQFNDKSEKVREGIVIKASIDYSLGGNKQALKWVSEAYLSDETNTDDH